MQLIYKKRTIGKKYNSFKSQVKLAIWIPYTDLVTLNFTKPGIKYLL